MFPGCLIPSLGALEEAWRDASSFELVHAEQIGEHYGPTLAAWRERFHARYRGRAQARLRRALRADLGLLPRELRGAVPHRADARRAAGARAVSLVDRTLERDLVPSGCSGSASARTCAGGCARSGGEARARRRRSSRSCARRRSRSSPRWRTTSTTRSRRSSSSSCSARASSTARACGRAATRTLAEAEEAMLALTCERAADRGRAAHPRPRLRLGLVHAVRGRALPERAHHRRLELVLQREFIESRARARLGTSRS